MTERQTLSPETTAIQPFATVLLDAEHIRQFSLAMRDSNPVHLDEQFCRSLGLAGIIAPGGIAVVALAHTAVRAYGLQAIREIDVSFKSPVPVGERLLCHAEVVAVESDHVVLQCRATSEAGELRAEGRVIVRTSS
jgi:acyl dehydratase